ncbi:hypothetical protein EJB05_31794, partial [Eragrostis curvula]
MMALWPNLGTLDQHSCSFNYSRLILMPTNLRSVTIVECDDTTYLNWVHVPRMQSFIYSGSFLEAPLILPGDASLSNLYIWLQFNKPLLNDLSGVNVLTICSDALPMFHGKDDIYRNAARTLVALAFDRMYEEKQSVGCLLVPTSQQARSIF